jgi:hypothetical protein
MLLETRARRLSRGKIRCLEWLCPICRELCSPVDLRVDVVIQNFLKLTHSSVNEIIVDSQCNFRSKNSDNSLSVDQIIDLTSFETFFIFNSPFGLPSSILLSCFSQVMSWKVPWKVPSKSMIFMKSKVCSGTDFFNVSNFRINKSSYRGAA